MKPRLASEVWDEIRARDPLRDFYSRWDTVDESDIDALSDALDSATREEDIQQFLQANPKYLIQHLGGGHGRWIIPKQRLGVQHVTDFMIGERDSMGFRWQAVELESPLAKMFTKSGNPSAPLTHAIRQIQDWRMWLAVNQNYAARDRGEDGLGLTEIHPDVQGLIIMGRRATESEDTRRLRRQIGRDSKIEIHTFDYLIESLIGRVKSLKKSL
ncbi:Shedu anti-phage system protein SduA domain-containing protein [Paraburkholderia sp. BCC1886]|uniref:Shedu anti-phage system protein SduA domain-containing protein n=1 Tax=Paraburkholderia sp. BCC1886 TaxID=2562670 RepID=UPI0011821EFB|nr:Shedu anti-phage system protein SduA domain-containing protein [Paraburkholderia sp. BCC1886]